MRLTRRPTRWLSGWMVAALLFMQFATAAYACPVQQAAATQPSMAHMPGCDGNMPGAMDPDQPLLCQAHCQQGSQTVNPTPALDAPVTPVLLAVLDWTLADLSPVPEFARMPLRAAGASPPGTPPLYLSLLVLRR